MGGFPERGDIAESVIVFLSRQLGVPAAHVVRGGLGARERADTNGRRCESGKNLGVSRGLSLALANPV